jgi:hypothetical protein
MIGTCSVTVRYEGMAPGGGVGVAEGEGKLPSLADTIAAVRRELGAVICPELSGQRIYG